MGRGLRKKLVLSIGLIAFIFTILSLIVIAGCSNTLMDDVLEKIHEDKIADGTAETYSVTYDGNGSDGGTVPTDSNAYVEGASVSVLGPGTMTRSGGYSFIGWNTKPDGSGSARGISDIFSMGTSDLTFYAQWTDLDTYNVYYSGNGNDNGTIPTDDSAYVEGAMVTILGNPGNLVLTDNNFGGWNRRIDGEGTNYTQGETFTIGSDDVTLHAKWTLKPYTVTYDGNGETGGTVPDTHYYNAGETVTVQGNTGNLVKTGDFFNGWNTQTDGNGTNYAAGTGTFTMEDSDEILYAWWPMSGVLFKDMVSVTGGTFTQTDGTNSFSHTISTFNMANYEVTYELWYTVHDWALSNGYTFANPGKEGNDGTLTDPAGAAPTGAKYEPVTNINWRDAIVWCNAYSEMSGYTPVYENGIGQVIKDSRDSNGAECDAAVPDWGVNGYRLPAEGEWQYAASNKGGIFWNHASGDTSSYCYPADGGTSTVFGSYAWYYDNSDTGSGVKTQDVGTKTENELVIYDMSGNVREWCWDWGGIYPVESETDYTGASSGFNRVWRGGSWKSPAYYLQVGSRRYQSQSDENDLIGFRLASGQ